MLSGSICVVATDCSVPRCSGNGYCVVPVDSWLCHCFEGWSGDDCSVEDEGPGPRVAGASLSSAAIAGIVLALLLLLSKHYQQSFTLASPARCHEFT